MAGALHGQTALVTGGAYGGLNILVNNAMQVPHGTLLEISDETVNAAWLSGPMASLRLMRLCHPYLK